MAGNLLGNTFGKVPGGAAFSLAWVALTHFALAVYAKRWHDRDKSGWWTFIALSQYGPDSLA